MTSAYTFTVVPDGDIDAVRAAGETASVLALFHGRYSLANESGLNADDYDSWTEVRDAIIAHGGINVTPVWMYDHSGITLRVGESNPFSCPWDSRMVGFAYTMPNLLAEHGIPDEDIDGIIDAEVTEYAAWLSGDVYAVEVRGASGTVVEYVGGFTDEDVAAAEGRSIVEYLNRAA